MSEEAHRAESPGTHAPTDPESLSIAVRTQVEYYFSRENLRNDSFLQSKMDAQNAVSLTIVMGFAKLRALTLDEQLVISSLESSSLVVFADGKIKPKGSGRSTIILREIPSDASEESVREIFAYPGAKSVCSLRSEIGDTWFITMESEEDAKDTIMDLKLKKRCFNSVAVKARLKTDAGLRSMYPSTNVVPLAYPGMPFQPYGVMDSNSYGYETPATAAAAPATQSRDKSSGYTRNGSKDLDDTEPNAEQGVVGSPPRRDGKDRNTTNPSNNRNLKTGHPSNSSNSNNNRDRDNRKNGSGKGPGGRDRKETAASHVAPAPAIEINSSSDFPPLAPHGMHSNENESPTPVHTIPSIPLATIVQNSIQSQPASNSAPTTSAPVSTTGAIPPRGYQSSFVRYSIDDILHIVSGIKDAVLPGSIALAQHSAALVTSPNTDLLLRQRTFSIDETRAQMQLGRPVQREAVLTGEVDYGSLIYGEEDHTSQPVQGHEQPQQHTHEKKPVKSSGGGSWAGVLMKAGAPAPPAPTVSPTKTTPPTADKALPAPGANATPAKSEKTTKGGEKKKGPKPQQDGAMAAKKEGATAAPQAPGDGKKQRNRRRAGSQGDASSGSKGPEEGVATGGEKSAPVPSSWGGRPTFANVLKTQQEEAAAAAAAAQAGGTPNATSTTPTKSTPPSQPNRPQQGGHKGPPANNTHSDKSQSQGQNKPQHNNAQPAKKLATNPDGTWVRDKLPPR